MAKKEKKEKKTAVTETPENMLPQNILPVGERVDADKNIYISQDAYKEIQKFTKNKTTVESGGMLVGTIIEEFGKTNIIISGFVEAKYCDATPTTLKFTHETWKYVHKEIEKKHKGKKIVGWIHTHPDFGIFLSEYDKFIHQNFFSEEYQVAYVVDPIQSIEGFYFWINGNIEKCKGFYIYEKTGKEITVAVVKEEKEEKKEKTAFFNANDVLVMVLSLAVAFLLFSNMSLTKQVKSLDSQIDNLEKQQQSTSFSTYQTLIQLQQTITSKQAEIDELRAVLVEAGLIEEPVEEGTEAGEGETEATEEGAEESATDEGATEETTGATEGGSTANE